MLTSAIGPKSNMRIPLSKQRGFTLLEMMVVIGLIALVSMSILLTYPSGDQAQNPRAGEK